MKLEIKISNVIKNVKSNYLKDSKTKEKNAGII